MKYFFQLHYGIKKDYRNFDLMKRGNFYQDRLMGVIRAEPARVTDWAAKSVGAVWRAFDLQLMTYAGLLAAIGLVMAYTNSVEDGKLTARGADDLHARPDVGRDRGRRVHRSRPRSTTAGSRRSRGRSTSSSSVCWR